MIHETISPAQQSSRLRLWAPVLSMTLLGLLSYVDRSVLAILSPTILASLHLSATQYGYAIFVFSLCYMAANPVWGLWMDRRGLWSITLLAVLLWSVASGSHGLITGFLGLCLARGVLGFGEGATFPAGLKTVAETLPAEKRSFGLGIAYSGSSLGAALTPLLITPIALRWGWRAAFGVTAVLGLAWILLWIVLRQAGLYKPPQQEWQCADVQRNSFHLSRNMLATAVIYGLGAAPLAFGLYAAPLYLTRVLHLNQASLGHLLWLPPAGWEAGYLVFGRIADRLRRNEGARQGTKGTHGIVFGVLSALSFSIVLTSLAAVSVRPVFTTMAVFVFSMFVAGGFVVFALSDGMAVVPPSQSAFLSGVSISSWALVTGILMPGIGKLVDQGRYAATFWLVACLAVAGTILWWIVREE